LSATTTTAEATDHVNMSKNESFPMPSNVVIDSIDHAKRRRVEVVSTETSTTVYPIDATGTQPVPLSPSPFYHLSDVVCCNCFHACLPLHLTFVSGSTLTHDHEAAGVALNAALTADTLTKLPSGHTGAGAADEAPRNSQ
jgi:hypothetical protein